MPLYTGAQRKSAVPEVYRRSSMGHKLTPYYGRRRSSPLQNEKETTQDLSRFVNEPHPNQIFGKHSSFSFKKLNIKRGSSNKSSGLTTDTVDKRPELANQVADNITVSSKEKPKPKETKISRRQTEHAPKVPTEKPSRFSMACRRLSSKLDKGNRISPKDSDLVIICQLLLHRTITPKENESLTLNEQFDTQLDQNYFEYYPFVFKYLIEREKRIKFNQNYLVSNGFSENFRGKLIDWLIKVQLYTKINSESLQVAIVLIDMFTSMAMIKKSYYQLVGVGALLIACKVVQRVHPKVQVLSYLTEDLYLPYHIVKMESILLERLDFFVNIPIPMHFYHRGLLACIEILDTDQLKLFCDFMFDLVLLHPGSPGIRSSCKSAAAIFIGRFIFHPEYKPWTKILEHYTMYRNDDLKDCVFIYLEMLQNVYKNGQYQFKTVLSKFSLPIRKAIAQDKVLVKFATSNEAKQKIKNYFLKMNE